MRGHAYPKKPFNFNNFLFVKTIAVREAAVLQESEQASIDCANSSENRDCSAEVQVCRAQCCQDGTNNDLDNHEEPSEDAENVVAEIVVPSLGDDISIETRWETLRGPIPAGGMESNTVFLNVAADLVGAAGPTA